MSLTNKELAECCVKSFLRIRTRDRIPKEYTDLVADIEGCLEFKDQKLRDTVPTSNVDLDLVKRAIKDGRAVDTEYASLEELESIGRLIASRKPDF